MIVADGAPGIWKAIRELFEHPAEQRCTVHALRNLTSKLPARLHREVKARYWQILHDATSAAEAKAGLLALAGDYRTAYPSATKTIAMTMSTSSSAICASRSSTASTPGRRTCWNAPSSRSAGAPRSSGGVPGRPARRSCRAGRGSRGR